MAQKSCPGPRSSLSGELGFGCDDHAVADHRSWKSSAWIWPKDSVSWSARANTAAQDPKRLFFLIQCIPTLATSNNIVRAARSKSAKMVLQWVCHECFSANLQAESRFRHQADICLRYHAMPANDLKRTQGPSSNSSPDLMSNSLCLRYFSRSAK